jgi:type III restriction enzyme
VKSTRRVHAEPDRAGAQISFPRLTGYRIELPDEDLFADFSGSNHLVLSTAGLPTSTVVSGMIGPADTHRLNERRDIRDQEVAFDLTRRVLDLYLGDQDSRPWYFPQVLRITKQWLAECLTCDSQAFPGLLLKGEQADEAARLIRNEILTAQSGHRTPAVRPMLAPSPAGSTATVDFYTTKEVCQTSQRRCHVNFVTLDGPHGNTWEQTVTQLLETMPSVAAYAKNDHLGFVIPYTFHGRGRQYLPDFLVRLQPQDGDDETRTLIVEVSGSRKPPGEAREKAETTRTLWLPAVNNHGGFGRWSYCELKDPAAFRPDLEGAIAALRAGTGASAVLAPLTSYEED